MRASRTPDPAPPSDAALPAWDPVHRLLDGPRGAVRLSESEARLWGALLAADGAPVGRSELAQQAELGDDRAVDFAVRRIRSKIEADPSAPRLLLTVHGHGYRLGVARPLPVPQPPRERLRLADRLIDVELGLVEVLGEERPLTTQEGALLRALVSAGGRVVRREELQVAVWGRRQAQLARRVDAVVRRLRLAIEPCPSRPVHLLTAEGGYRLRFEAPRTNLGPPPGPLVGRDQALDSLLSASEAHGWIQIVGPPGAGKSALAQHLGDLLADRLPGGAWWVDCSEERTSDGVLRVLRRVLGLDHDIDTRSLVAALRRRPRTALLLDPLEQVAGADRLVETLARAGVLVVGVSTRELALDGGRTVPLGGLATADGVALYREIARDSGAPLGEDALEGVRAFVEAVDGLPLPIVFAARTARRLGPADLARTLALDLSVGPTRAASLRTALDRAWQLASPGERRTLVALSVFRGPFSIETAAAVTGAPPEEIEALHRSSWIVELPWGSSRRFRPYALVAEYLAEHPVPREVREAHARWFAEHARALVQQRFGPDHDRAVREGSLCHTDFEAAATFLSETQPEEAAALLVAWDLNGRPPIELADRLLASPVGAFPSRSRLWLCRSHHHRHQGDPDAALGAIEAAVREGLDPLDWYLHVERFDVLLDQNRPDLMEIPPQPADARFVAHWHVVRGYVLGHRGEIHEGLAAIAWGRQLARRQQIRRLEEAADGADCILRMLLPEAPAETLAKTFAALAASQEARGELDVASRNLAMASQCRARIGHVSAARELALRALRIGNDLGLMRLEAKARMALLRCGASSDDPSELVDLAITTRAELEALGFPSRGLADYVHAVGLARGGDRAAAIAVARAAIPTVTPGLGAALRALIALLDPTAEVPDVGGWVWTRSVILLARHLRLGEPLCGAALQDSRRDPLVLAAAMLHRGAISAPPRSGEE